MSNGEQWGPPGPSDEHRSVSPASGEPHRPAGPARLSEPPPEGWHFQSPPRLEVTRRRVPLSWILTPLAFLVVLVVVFFVVVRPILGWPSYGPDGGDGKDPLLPKIGAAGYDAQNYRIDVTWQEDRELVAGTTTMTAVATQDLGSLHLDLLSTAEEVRLDGAKVSFTQQGTDLRVRTSQKLSKGQRFDVTVRYAGLPDGAEDMLDSLRAKKNREWVFAAEPLGALLWFPSNGHPQDPATMQVTAHVPKGLQAISAGRLLSRELTQDPQRDTWSWQVDQPVPTYSNYLAIGDFQISESTAGDRAYVSAVSKQLDPLLAEGVTRVLERTPEMVRTLEQVWGPYPSKDLGGLVPAGKFEFQGLEAQGRPLYDANALAQQPDKLLSHELSHMWFGNQVTMRGWGDLYMNEAYASYSEWAVAERSNRADLNRQMVEAYDRVPDGEWNRAISKPEPMAISMSGYVRGPLAMQALRNLMGDEAFFSLGREWAAQQGPKSLDDWRAMARSHSRTDLENYFAVWIDGTQKPEKTAANGFR